MSSGGSARQGETSQGPVASGSNVNATMETAVEATAEEQIERSTQSAAALAFEYLR
jgi:hypothetical protein